MDSKYLSRQIEKEIKEYFIEFGNDVILLDYFDSIEIKSGDMEIFKKKNIRSMNNE